MSKNLESQDDFLFDLVFPLVFNIQLLWILMLLNVNFLIPNEGAMMKTKLKNI
jgi:hypothetical protein